MPKSPLPGPPPSTRTWSPEEAVLDRFATWYMSDELTDDWTDDLENSARNSASSLRAAVGSAQVPALARLLRALRADRAHPLSRAIESETLLDWTSEEENWSTYQRLLAAIESHL